MEGNWRLKGAGWGMGAVEAVDVLVVKQCIDILQGFML